MTVDSPPAPATHRERKKQATRQAIHEAAFDLAERLGLSATTVEAISERAGVAVRTFWSYFSSKEDAVLGKDPAWPAELHRSLLERPANEEPLVALRMVLEQFLAERVVDSGRALRRQRLIEREPQLMAAAAAHFDAIERALVEAVAERMGVEPDGSMRPGVLVATAGGACRVAQRRWAGSDGGRPLTDVLDEAFHVLAEGVEPLLMSRSAR